jgi:hypothetical protein
MRSRALEISAAFEAELAERYLQVKQLRRMLKQAEMLRARLPRRARRKHLGANIKLQRGRSPTR